MDSNSNHQQEEEEEQEQQQEQQSSSPLPQTTPNEKTINSLQNLTNNINNINPINQDSTSIFNNIKNSLINANSQTNGFTNHILQNIQIHNNEDYFANSRSIRMNDKFNEDNQQNIFDQEPLQMLFPQNFPLTQFNQNNNSININQKSQNNNTIDGILKPVANKGKINNNNSTNNNNNNLDSNKYIQEQENDIEEQDGEEGDDGDMSEKRAVELKVEQISLNQSNQSQEKEKPLKTKFNIQSVQLDEEDDMDRQKNTRGLRYLSLQVKQIVCQKKQTTYKEVADTLVNNLKAQNSYNQLNEEEIIKDEQNIKRRVYDALNVLIASQIIQKKGKIVQSCENSFLNGRCLEKESWDLVKEKQKTVQKKKEMLNQKKRIVHDFIEKTIALKNLIKRNSDHKPEDKKHIFHFPLTQISFKPEEDSMKKDKRSLMIKSKNPVYIYGDLDIITNMNFHKADQEFMEEIISKDMLEQFYSEEYQMAGLKKKIKTE